MDGNFDIGRRAAGVFSLLGALALGGQTAGAQINKVIYNCHDHTGVNATYDIGGDTLTLEIAGTVTIRLNQAVSGSGVRYVGGGGYEAYGKGKSLNIIRPGQPELRCSEIGRINPPAPQRQGLPRPFQPQQQFTPPPVLQQGGAGSFAAKSWGGIVRSGPGQQHAKIASLNEGERITVLQQTGQIFQDRPWFKISFRGRTGYHWGGIICPLGHPVPGTFQVCN